MSTNADAQPAVPEEPAGARAPETPETAPPEAPAAEAPPEPPAAAATPAAAPQAQAQEAPPSGAQPEMAAADSGATHADAGATHADAGATHADAGATHADAGRQPDSGAAATEPAPASPQTGTDAPAAAKKPGKRKRPPRPRKPNIPKDLPRSRAPLPLDELRDASRATLDLFGREGIREAFLILAPRERQDISALIAADDDHRPRTRNIANGSLGAGRIDKAMSATIISMAKVEDLWAITLDKESAAAKSGRIRAAKQRDKEKAERAKERANRADRVSREDMAKARDGSVGATIRIVTDEKRERGKKDDQQAAEKPARESVLDKLGY